MISQSKEARRYCLHLLKAHRCEIQAARSSPEGIELLRCRPFLPIDEVVEDEEDEESIFEGSPHSDEPGSLVPMNPFHRQGFRFRSLLSQPLEQQELQIHMLFRVETMRLATDMWLAKHKNGLYTPPLILPHIVYRQMPKDMQGKADIHAPGDIRYARKIPTTNELLSKYQQLIRRKSWPPPSYYSKLLFVYGGELDERVIFPIWNRIKS